MKKNSTDRLKKSNVKKYGTPTTKLKPGSVKDGFFCVFLFFSKRNLIFKDYYRRVKIGVKKGISTPTLPPKTLKLLAHPIIRIFRFLYPFCAFICLSIKLYVLNIFLKYIIFIIFILNIFFIYITVVRSINIIKFIKAGAYDIRNSPLDKLVLS